MMNGQKTQTQDVLSEVRRILMQTRSSRPPAMSACCSSKQQETCCGLSEKSRSRWSSDHRLGVRAC